MVLVSKAIATTKQGKVKKGYRVIDTKNGRQMYFSETAAKKDTEKKDKKVKKDKSVIVETEDKEKLTVEF